MTFVFFLNSLFQTYRNLKQQLLSCEMLLLQSIAFDLKVTHPYGSLLGYVKTFDGGKNFAQIAWNFLNDSLLRTNLCLQYPPEQIAVASICLAAKLIPQDGNQPNQNTKDITAAMNVLAGQDGKEWWEKFNVPYETLQGKLL